MIGSANCAQVRQVPQVALESRDARRLRLLASQLGDAVAVVGRQAVEPPPPARLAVGAAAAADDRRFDDQLFPLPGRPQRAGDDGLVVRIDGSGAPCRRAAHRSSGCCPSSVAPGPRETPRRAAIVGPAAPPRSGPPAPPCRPPICGTWPSDRYSSNRLAESPSHGAREQRDERAAGGIGPPRAAIEVGGHAAARARMLEQAEVLLRRPQEDGHLVERHAARGFVERAPDDLHGFASLARRREQADVARARPRRRAIGREDEAAQVRQIGLLARRDRPRSRSRRAARRLRSASSADSSPSGTVASTAGERATSAPTNARSALESSGTSSSTSGSAAHRTCPSPHARAARRNSSARSVDRRPAAAAPRCAREDGRRRAPRGFAVLEIGRRLTPARRSS